MSTVPNITRVRHELKRRVAPVVRVEKLSAGMVRVTLRGDELRGFISLGFDDHVKVFFPDADGHLNLLPPGATPGEGQAPPMSRDFTPRSFDAQAGELVIDFYLHEHGPASTWAAQAVPGQVLGFGGPRGSAVIALEGIDLHLLIGDETALPAIGRRLEELPAGARALVVAEIEPEATLNLTSRAHFDVAWVHRGRTSAAPGELLIGALRSLSLAKENCFAWVATETQAARAIRQYLTQERGFDKRWVKAAGYWQRGATGSHVVVDD